MIDERPELLNAMIYALEYFPAGDVETPRLIAEAIADERVLTGGLEGYRRDARQALDSRLDLAFGDTDDTTVRAFLMDLLEYLEAPQPWPVPELRRISLMQWRDDDEPALLGSIGASVQDVAGRLQRPFDRILQGDRKLLLLRLSLHTGQRLLMQSTPDHADERVDVYSPDDPADVIEAFHRITGIAITPAT